MLKCNQHTFLLKNIIIRRIIIRNTIFIFSSLIFILTDYNNSIDKEITEKKEKEIVINCHDSDVGEVDVISVVDKSEKYIIKWENDPLEEGTDSVNKTTGELKTIESSRGSC